MGKIILISGANGSGKSRYAEGLVAQTTGRRCYVATMHWDEVNCPRIERHIIQRQGLGFETLESPYQVGDLPVGTEDVVLLEDVSNLLGNAVFEKNSDVSSVYEDIIQLSNRCKVIYIVTISGLSEKEYQGETAEYIQWLNQLNDWLEEVAEASVRMQDGVPYLRKGDRSDLV